MYGRFTPPGQKEPTSERLRRRGGADEACLIHGADPLSPIHPPTWQPSTTDTGALHIVQCHADRGTSIWHNASKQRPPAVQKTTKQKLVFLPGNRRSNPGQKIPLHQTMFTPPFDANDSTARKTTLVRREDAHVPHLSLLLVLADDQGVGDFLPSLRVGQVKPATGVIYLFIYLFQVHMLHVYQAGLVNS